MAFDRTGQESKGAALPDTFRQNPHTPISVTDDKDWSKVKSDHVAIECIPFLTWNMMGGQCWFDPTRKRTDNGFGHQETDAEYDERIKRLVADIVKYIQSDNYLILHLQEVSDKLKSAIEAALPDGWKLEFRATPPARFGVATVYDGNCLEAQPYQDLDYKSEPTEQRDRYLGIQFINKDPANVPLPEEFLDINIHQDFTRNHYTTLNHLTGTLSKYPLLICGDINENIQNIRSHIKGGDNLVIHGDKSSFSHNFSTGGVNYQTIDAMFMTSAFHRTVAQKIDAYKARMAAAPVAAPAPAPAAEVEVKAPLKSSSATFFAAPAAANSKYKPSDLAHLIKQIKTMTEKYDELKGSDTTHHGELDTVYRKAEQENKDANKTPEDKFKACIKLLVDHYEANLKRNLKIGLGVSPMPAQYEKYAESLNDWIGHYGFKHHSSRMPALLLKAVNQTFPLKDIDQNYAHLAASLEKVEDVSRSEYEFLRPDKSQPRCF